MWLDPVEIYKCHAWLVCKEREEGWLLANRGLVSPSDSICTYLSLALSIFFLLTVFKAGSIVNTFLLNINTRVADFDLNSV